MPQFALTIEVAARLRLVLAEVTVEGSIAGDAFARITASASAASYDPRPFPAQRVEEARSALRSMEREGR